MSTNSLSCDGFDLPNFTNQFSAVCQAGGLVATAFKPNEIIQVTGRLTAEEIEKKRRSISIFTQDLLPVISIAVDTKALIAQIGWTTCGKLAVLTDDGEVMLYNIADPAIPIATYLVADKSQIQSNCLVLFRFIQLKEASLCALVYNQKYSVIYCLILQSLKVSPQITSYPLPGRVRPVSFDMQRDTKPGTCLLESSDRPQKPLQNLQDGDLYLLVLCQNGSVFKLKTQIAGSRDVEQLITQNPVSVNSMLRLDASGQFCAILQPTGLNYVSNSGIALKEEMFQKISQYKTQSEEQRKQNIEQDKDIAKIIYNLQKEDSLDQQIKHYQEKNMGVLKIYDFTLQRLYVEIRIPQGQNLQLFWIGDSLPAIFSKQEQNYKLTLYNQKQQVEYTLPNGCGQPVISQEVDCLRIISSKGSQMLKPIHPFTALMFHPNFAQSEPAHLLEAFISYESGSFDSDSLARILQDRNKNLFDLLLGALQVAESEDPRWSFLVYNAIRYFKLFTGDQQQKDDISNSYKDFAVRRSIGEYDVNWATGGFLAYVQSIITGKSVTVLYQKGEVVRFSNKIITIDSATGKNQDQFYFGDYLTDCYVLSRKLYLAVQILKENNIYATVEQIKAIGIINIISNLTSQKKFTVAVKLCKLFELPQEDLVIEYIMQLIANNPQKSDRELERLIINKRNNCPTLQYRRIALAVVEQGRNKLAMMLLEQEPSIEAKVQLYLKINDYAGAIKTALKGGDASLAHTSLQLATESQIGLCQVVNLINQDFQVLQVFFQVNKLLKPDLLFSIGSSSDPQNSIFLAEASYRKAKSVKQHKHAAQLLDEAILYSKQAKDRHIEIYKALKKQSFEQITFEVKTDVELERIQNKALSIGGDYEHASVMKVCQTEQKAYFLSLLGMDSFCEVLESENKLLAFQRDLGDGKKLIGLSVFDTLLWLQTRQFAYLHEKGKETELVDFQPQIDKFIKTMQVSPEIQLAVFLKALGGNSAYYAHLQNLKAFKKPDPLVCFKTAARLNSITAASGFAGLLASDGLKFRCFLQIRQDAQCVALFRKLGLQGLQEVHGEFYGQPGAQQVITRLIYEFNVTNLNDKTESEKQDQEKKKGKEKAKEK